MAQKKKKIVWHKRGGKFISSSFLKPHGRNPGGENTSASSDKAREDRKKIFWQDLSAKIKKAVQRGPGGNGQ